MINPIFTEIPPLFASTLKSGLYLIMCVPLEKYYIGQSSNVTRRINAHKSTLRRNCHENSQLQKDYITYGVDSFIFKKLLLGVGCDAKVLESLETDVLLTLPVEKKYNVYTNWRTRGSENNPFIGKTHTPEARKAQSDAKKGKSSNFAGSTQSNKVKQLISEQNRGQSSKDRRKPLYIDSRYYESITEASEKTGLVRRLIRERCNSTQERFKHYCWVAGPTFIP
jgi:group I intron endonuclease